MTQGELDQIVHSVGNELLTRLGRLPDSAAVDAAACGCGPGAAASNGAAGGLISTPPENEVTCPDWTPPEGGIAGLIDHTLLRPDAAEAEIAAACAEACTHHFAAVCVHPGWVALTARELRGTAVKTCTVVGFPHGATLTPVKCVEAEQAMKLGADEIDMVLPIGALKSGQDDRVYTEIRCVAELVHSAKKVLKVILETALLSDHEKALACVLAKLAGADFVKTSTGFGPAGASTRDVALMHRVVGGELGIKAAGGISTYPDLAQMMRAGATLIGSSSGVGIVAEATASGIDAEAAAAGVVPGARG